MNPTSKPVKITLDGKPYSLLFDLNTFDKFEEVSGKFFLDFLASIQDALQKARDEAKGNPQAEAALASTLMRSIRLGDIHKFIWAALHTYDREDNPIWPISLNKLGRLIDISTIPTLLPALLNGTTENLPEPDKQEPDNVRPINGSLSTQEDGGLESGPSDEEILGSLTLVSAG
jgi:hypothetical protein